jgi:hypothetical protein
MSKKKASYEVHFRCESEPSLFFRYETDAADGFVPRKGESVLLPPKDGNPHRSYAVTQVTTVVHRLLVDETYPVTNCFLGSIICDVTLDDDEPVNLKDLPSMSRFVS